jgi:hypothetical protein
VILPLKPGAGLTLEQQWGADGGAFEEAVRDRLAAAAAAAVDVRSFVRVAVPGSDEVRARDPRSADPDPGPSKSPTGRKLVKPLPVGRADAAKRRPTGGLSQQQGGAKEPPGVPDVPVGPRLAVRSDAPARGLSRPPHRTRVDQPRLVPSRNPAFPTPEPGICAYLKTISLD